MKLNSLFNSQQIHFDFGLLLIRLIIGLLMAFYGYEKLIHFDEMAASEFWTNNVSFMGMHGKVPLVLTIFAELFCSIFLILGLFTRFSLLVLLFCMGYIFVVIFPFNIVNKGDNGYQFNDAFVYFMVYLGLLFTGSGKFSADYYFFKK